MHEHSSHEHKDAPSSARYKGLPDARKTELVELADGAEFELEILPVKKRIGNATVRMLAYNGSIPDRPEGAAGRDDHGSGDQPRRSRGDGALAWLTARESL